MSKISTHVHPHRICEQLYIFCIHYVTVICKIWFLFYVEKLKKPNFTYQRAHTIRCDWGRLCHAPDLLAKIDVTSRR